MNDHAAGASPVDRPVRPAAEARWYCLDRDGVAMLCKDEADARAQVIESDDCWPGRAPHRAVLLIEANAADAHIPMGRLIELETAEHERDILRTEIEQWRRSAERCEGATMIEEQELQLAELAFDCVRAVLEGSNTITIARTGPKRIPGFPRGQLLSVGANGYRNYAVCPVKILAWIHSGTTGAKKVGAAIDAAKDGKA